MRKPYLLILKVFESLGKIRSFQILLALVMFRMLFFSLENPFVFQPGFASIFQSSISSHFKLDREMDWKQVPSRPLKSFVFKSFQTPTPMSQLPETGKINVLSGLRFYSENVGKNGSMVFQEFAKTAWEQGRKRWENLDSNMIQEPVQNPKQNATNCPRSISLSETELHSNRILLELPCGLTPGSNFTIVGKPRKGHWEKNKNSEELILVSKFVLELQGLREKGAREPTRVFHFNPRLSGDRSGMPTIELNTYYRGQWSRPQRCTGSLSKPDELTVDGKVKCEKWDHTKGSSAEDNTTELQAVNHKREIDSPFPFGEEKLFCLSLSVGVDGFHVDLDGKHVTSFPHHKDMSPEDAIRLSVEGDIDVYTVSVGSLPTSSISSSPQRHLEFSSRWQAPALASQHIEMFIGILSAGDNFSQRMSIRKTWMQHELLRASRVVARFFVALHASLEVNLELKKEAEFFGDIVIVPYLDHYDLVVLKTLAICHYGVRMVSANYVMKCDDDTFVRLDAVIDEIKQVQEGKSLYLGNMNYHSRPRRKGKWSVTLDEWPDEHYPIYADGPGYILSSDVVSFIVDQFERDSLTLFKMEDVSTGIWVEEFNNGTNRVDYRHSVRFCQFGCIKNYITAHYQSAIQMICLWSKLRLWERAECCM